MSSTPIFNPGQGTGSANTVNGNFTVTGNTDLKENLTVGGNEIVNGNLTVFGTINSGGGGGTGVFGSLSVSGNSQLGTIGSTATTNTSHSTLDDGAGNAHFAGNVEVDGHLINSTGAAINLPTTAGTLALTSQIPAGTVVTTTTLNNNTLPASLTTLSVSGTSSLGTVNEGATTMSSATVSGTLSAGSTTLATASVSGTLMAGASTLTSAAVSGTLSAGATTLASAVVSGSLSAGASTLASAVVSGSLSAASAAIAGTLSAGASTLASAVVGGSPVITQSTINSNSFPASFTGVASSSPTTNLGASANSNNIIHQISGSGGNQLISTANTWAVFNDAINRNILYCDNGGNFQLPGNSINFGNVTLTGNAAPQTYTLPNATGTISLNPSSGSYVTTTTLNNNTLPATVTSLISSGLIQGNGTDSGTGGAPGGATYPLVTIGGVDQNNHPYIQGFASNTGAQLDLNPRGQLVATGGNLSVTGALGAASAAVSGAISANSASVGTGGLAVNGNTSTFYIAAPSAPGGITFSYPGQNTTSINAIGNIVLNGDSNAGQATNELVVGGSQVVANVPLVVNGSSTFNGTQITNTTSTLGFSSAAVQVNNSSTASGLVEAWVAPNATSPGSQISIGIGSAISSGNLTQWSFQSATTANPISMGPVNATSPFQVISFVGGQGGRLYLGGVNQPGTYTRNNTLDNATGALIISGLASFNGGISATGTVNLGTGSLSIPAPTITNTSTANTTTLIPNTGFNGSINLPAAAGTLALAPTSGTYVTTTQLNSGTLPANLTSAAVIGNLTLNNTILQGNTTGNTIGFPAASGTVALTSQLPVSLTSWNGGGSAGSLAVFQQNGPANVTVSGNVFSILPTGTKWKAVVTAYGTQSASSTCSMVWSGGMNFFSNSSGGAINMQVATVNIGLEAACLFTTTGSAQNLTLTFTAFTPATNGVTVTITQLA